MPIKRILVATDLSAHSARALRRAAQLAAQWQAELEVVTVLPTNWLGQIRRWLAGSKVEASAAAVEARLQEAVEPLRHHRLRRLTAGVLEGDARIELVRHAAEVGADLLVVGSHGLGLIGEMTLGSTALALLERCDAPILTVRRNDEAPYRRLLGGVAFEPAARGALELALLHWPQADFTFAHVYESPFAAELFIGQASPETEAFYLERAHQQARAQFDAFVGAIGPAAEKVHRRLIHGPPGLRLARLAQHLAVDLVVLGSRRKSALEAAFLSSVASNVAMLVPTDVLLVREAAAAQP